MTHKRSWQVISVIAILAFLVGMVPLVVQPNPVKADPGSYVFPGGSVTTGAGTWCGGSGVIYPATFDLTAGDLTLYAMDVDMKDSRERNWSCPYTPPLPAPTTFKTGFQFGITNQTTIGPCINPRSSAWMNQCWAGWNQALYYLGQQWYADATNQFQGPNFGWNTPYQNAGPQLANGGYHCTGDAEYDTFDYKMIFHDLGSGNGFRVTAFQRVHKTTNPLNNAAMTWFQMYDAPKYQDVPEAAVDKTAVKPFVFVGNWEYAAGGGTVTWGSVAAVHGAAPNEVWVDDDWAGSSEGQILSGHVFGYDAFATIQEGIDAVAAGGTVHVAAGTYTQNVTINKTVSMLGDSGAILSGTGSGNGFLVNGSNITIDGFEIKSYQIGIRSYGGPSSFGDLDILNCNIHNNSQNGVLLVYDTFSTVTIDGCQITNNTQNGIGISNSATIATYNVSNTTVSGNGRHGLYVAQANIPTLNIQNSSFDNSTTNGYSGITFGTTASTIGNFSMQGGSLSGNKGCGLSIVQAPSTFTSITLDGIAVNNNSESGMMLGGNTTPGVSTGSLTIQNCSFQGNAWEHLDISGGWFGKFGVTGSTNIVSNTFSGSPWAAIYIGDKASFGSTPQFHYNVFTLSNWGINDNSTSTPNAENNWWGANDGPSHSPGSGDKISATVDGDPWLVLNISANPADIVIGSVATSTIAADMTQNSDGADTSGAGHIPDGTQIVFTTDKGSIGSTTVTKSTTGGMATAVLTSTNTVETATVCAEAPHGASVPEAQYKVCTAVDFVEGESQSVPTATGTGVATFSYSLGDMTDLTALNSAQAPCAGQPPYYFPHGMFSFIIDNITPGTAVTIVITLPSPLPATAQYWKCQNGNWVNCTSLLGSMDGDNVVTLTITDGGLGDADGVANGTIVDPGGPAIPSVPAKELYDSASTGELPVQRTPPNLRPTNLSVSQARVRVNQPVTVTAEVVNAGELEGTTNVALIVNGFTEQVQKLRLGPGAAKTVTFTVEKAEPGKYDVSIGDQRASFIVLSEDKEGAATAQGSILPMLLMAGLFIVVIAILLMAFRRKQTY